MSGAERLALGAPFWEFQNDWADSEGIIHLLLAFFEIHFLLD